MTHIKIISDFKMEGTIPAMEWTAAFLFTAAFMGCADECDPDESGCNGNVAEICDTQYSDSHKSGNPYVWYTHDCTISDTGITGRCDETGNYPECVAEDFTAKVEEEKNFRLNTTLIAFGADAIKVTVGGESMILDGSNTQCSDEGGDNRSSLFFESEHYAEMHLHWTMNDVTRRLTLIFEGIDSYWWISDIYIDTYDSNGNEENWVSMQGTFCKTPIGSWFDGDFDASNEDENLTVVIDGLKLRVFQ